MHRHCFRTFTYWLKNLLWPTFLKTEGIYTIYLLKNINYFKKWFFFPFDWEREEELSVAVQIKWQSDRPQNYHVDNSSFWPPLIEMNIRIEDE